MDQHHLDDSAPHAYWDRDVDVRLEVESGDVVVIDCAEPCGQVTPRWTVNDFDDFDTDLVHALTGAIFVKGAQPGDALQIDVLAMEHKGWGWTSIFPGFGLLADDFSAPQVHHWELEGATCRFADGIELPAEPFPGVVGVAPEEPGRLDTIPPRSNGGNLDTRDLVAGSTAWLPIHAEGALFSIGDCHTAQGDGEVCGTGVESPMTATLRLTVRKDVAIREFQVRRTTPPVVPGPNVHITTAHGPDLYANAQNATRYMIEWLGNYRGLDAADAYMLCSTAGHLRISEIVDAPNWVVSLHFPLDIFQRT
jgi:acetamidase/formamidase